jgi:hypothetical protein
MQLDASQNGHHLAGALDYGRDNHARSRLINQTRRKPMSLPL